MVSNKEMWIRSCYFCHPFWEQSRYKLGRYQKFPATNSESSLSFCLEMYWLILLAFGNYVACLWNLIFSLGEFWIPKLSLSNAWMLLVCEYWYRLQDLHAKIRCCFDLCLFVPVFILLSWFFCHKPNFYIYILSRILLKQQSFYTFILYTHLISCAQKHTFLIHNLHWIFYQ